MTLDLKQEIVECGNTYCKNYQTQTKLEEYLKEETGAEEVEITYEHTETEWGVYIEFTFQHFRKGDEEILRKVFDGIDYHFSLGKFSADCTIHIEGEYK